MVSWRWHGLPIGFSALEMTRADCPVSSHVSACNNQRKQSILRQARQSSITFNSGQRASLCSGLPLPTPWELLPARTRIPLPSCGSRQSLCVLSRPSALFANALGSLKHWHSGPFFLPGSCTLSYADPRRFVTAAWINSSTCST